MVANLKTRVYSPYELFSSYVGPKDGLFAAIQPFIAQISYLTTLNTKLSYEEISDNYIKAFVVSSPVAVAFLDSKCQFRAVSQKWFSWFKKNLNIREKNSDFLIGRNFFDLFNPCPEPIKQMLKSSFKAKKNKNVLLKYDFKGRKKWVRWETFSWFDSIRQPKGIMVFCKDVTKHHIMITSNRKLQQCNQMLEEAVLVFFHDLIQPMRQIGNFIDLLKEHSKGQSNTDEFLDYAFSAIYESLNQIQNLSEGVILYCKQGKLTVNSEPVSFYKIIEQIKRSCLVLSEVDLRILIKEDVYIHANKVSILQLFQNLLINAVKYASLETPVVTLNGRKIDNGYYQFIIHNNVGENSPQVKKRMLEPFQSSNLDGAGLGLAICKKIVVAYNGTMQVKSSKKGTTVYINLPLEKTK